MKIPVIRKIRKEDLGGDLPQWVEKMLSPLNQFIEQVGVAVTGKLSFGDNIASKLLDLEFVHNQEQEVNVNDRRPVLGLVPIFCQSDTIDGFSFSQLSNGNIRVKILFAGAGSSPISCKILVIFP